MEEQDIIDRLQKQSEKTKEAIAAIRIELEKSLTATTSVFDESLKSTDSKVSHLTKTLQDLDQQLNAKFDALKATDYKQTLDIEELQKSDRAIEVKIQSVSTQCQSNTDRINGDIQYSNTEPMPIEQMRVHIATVKNDINGYGGDINLDYLINDARSKKAVNTTFRNWVSVLGSGTLITGAVAAFGLSRSPDLSPVVNKQTIQIEALADENKDLKSKLKGIEDKLWQLNAASKPAK